MSFTLLNTRPSHQAQALNKLIQKAGGTSIECPTIQIKWLDTPIPTIEGKVDKVIFISTNAVRGLLKLPSEWQQEVGEADCFAIGKATAELAQQNGLKIQTPSAMQFDSEHLLEQADMQQVSGENILIVKGRHGRKLIENTLIERGAKVYQWELYQRVAEPICLDDWTRLNGSIYPVLLITSIESWQNLNTAIENLSKNSSPALTAVVFSQRIADQMKSDGWFKPIQLVQTQSNQGIMDAIGQIVVEYRSS